MLEQGLNVSLSHSGWHATETQYLPMLVFLESLFPVLRKNVLLKALLISVPKTNGTAKKLGLPKLTTSF
jgi:hypothetical protein